MRLGKLSSEELKKYIFDNLSVGEHFYGAALAEDCAFFDSDGIIAVTTDPITAKCSNIGKRAIDVCLNDVATSLATPCYCIITLLLPPFCSLEAIDEIMREAAKEADIFGVKIIGGHTEFTDAVIRPIISVTMLARAEKKFTTLGIQANDCLILTGSIGKEGASIIFDAKKDELGELFSSSEKEELFKLKDELLVVNECAGVKDCNISGLHDVTEGGIISAATEMAELNGLGVVLEKEAITLTSPIRKLCEHYSIDPMKLMSSGSLLIATSKPSEILEALNKNGVLASIVGHFTIEKEKYMISEKGKEELAIYPDELYRIEL